jgi:hypothetical protein
MPGKVRGVLAVVLAVAVGGAAAARAGGALGNGESESPAISADGRFVAFGSNATNLVPGDTNDEFDVFVHAR